MEELIENFKCYLSIGHLCADRSIDTDYIKKLPQGKTDPCNAYTTPKTCKKQQNCTFCFERSRIMYTN
jgi:hypothetical protein